MINIVTSGCSFTHDPDSWANVLQKKLSDKYTVTNVADGGQGQEYIVRFAIKQLEKTVGAKICIVQISGFSRALMYIDKLENPVLYEQIRNEGKYRDQTFVGLNKVTRNMVGIKTTDIDHTWWKTFKLKNLRKVINGYNLAIATDQRIILSYENISRLQMYCKLNKIPLLCFYGWKQVEIEPNNPEFVNTIRSQVDWNNMWFHNKDGGMAEWMLDNGHHGKLEEDHINKPPTGIGKDPLSGNIFMVGHPTAEAHNDFCEQVIVPWVNSVSHE